MNKFNVGDLITDKTSLFQVVAVNEKTYTIKKIDENEVYTSFNVSKYIIENVAIKYDLSKPLTKIVRNGVCRCSNCSKELHYGDDCVRNNGDVYCDEQCLIEDLTRYSEDSVINENDLDDSSKVEKPLFELTEDEMKYILMKAHI